MNHNTQNLDRNQNEMSSRSHTTFLSSSKPTSVNSSLPFGAIGLGLLAGIVGVASMSMPEKSFRLTKKDEKKSDASTQKLEKTLRKPEKIGSSGWMVNHALHWGQGAISKLIKPNIANSNLQSTVPSFLFTGLRLSTDQILENLFRTGPQKNLSKNEKRMDLFQKAVYAFATGFFADLLMKSRSRPQLNP